MRGRQPIDMTVDEFVAWAKLDHGKYTTYGNHGCRCGPCTSAWADHHRGYMARRRETKRLTAIEEILLGSIGRTVAVLWGGQPYMGRVCSCGMETMFIGDGEERVLAACLEIPGIGTKLFNLDAVETVVVTPVQLTDEDFI